MLKLFTYVYYIVYAMVVDGQGYTDMFTVGALNHN